MTITRADYNELIISTMEKLDQNGNLVNQILTQHPLLELFQKEASSITGRELRVNLEIAEDGDTAFTDSSGTFNTNVSGDITDVAIFSNAKPLVSKLRIVWETLQQNSGKEQIVNLLKAHLNSAKEQHTRVITEALHARAGQGELKSGQFLSLDQLAGDHSYDADPAGDSSEPAFEVGQITPTDADHFWNAQRLEYPKDDSTFGTGNIRKVFRRVRNELSEKNASGHRVTHIVAGRNIFEEYEDSFDEQVRYVDFDKAQGQFRAIWDGDIQLRFDPDCPEDRAYFLNADSLRMAYVNGNWMKVQPAQSIQGTLDFVTPIASLILVGVSERRANAVLLRPDTAGGVA